jgi:aryl-alcohol dehydrogenase-like predicted oxidoreductase
MFAWHNDPSQPQMLLAEFQSLPTGLGTGISRCRPGQRAKMDRAMSAKPSSHLPLRPLGRTGLQVSPLGLGLAALGRPGYINLGHGQDIPEGHDEADMRQHADRILDAAWMAGIRYFDAARSYGKAEDFLGSWLDSRGVEPGQAVVGSKWGYTYTAGWKVEAKIHEVKDHSLDVLKKQWLETQQRLGAHLDLYQIHSATLESGVLSDHAVHQELARLKRQGVAIGLTASGPAQAAILERAAEIMFDGRPLFDCFQATWNLLERSAGAVLGDLHQAGFGIIVKEALANGRLTERNAEAQFIEAMRQLQAEAERLESTPDALALAAVLDQPWADVVLSGAATVSQLHSNLRSVNVGWDAAADLTLQSLADSPHTYWQRRASLRWN